jgi:DNA-binding LacI/PurR family transcriptional regulator
MPSGRQAKPGQRPTTMKQVGEIAGVSQSTVSRVLSGDSAGVSISPATRERILGIVADLGYSPNPQARALRGAKTGLIGVIVRDIEDPFFSTAVAAVSEEARSQGYNLLLGHVHSSADETLALAEVLETGQCDGLILLGDVRGQERLWSELRRCAIPVVGMWHGAMAPEIPVVNADNRLGVDLALEYLTSLGHEQIAFIQGGGTGDGLQRRTAYESFMSARGSAARSDWIRTCANNFRDAADTAADLLVHSPRPTAILASTDVVAAGVIKGASRLGLRIPQDVSVVGFDDIPLAEFTVPSLTTVHQPIQDVAHRGVAQLLELVHDPSATPRTSQVVVPSLIVRDSCAPTQGKSPSN